MCLLFFVGMASSHGALESSWRTLKKGFTLTVSLTVQEFPSQKPKYDYMSSFYSRNTKPLGLKEDVALRKLMRQPGIKWAVRSGIRHILN